MKADAMDRCGVTLTHSYYLARLMKSSKPEDQIMKSNVGFIWPNQQSTAININITVLAKQRMLHILKQH
jgi:iron(III) transport system substrate-binding protein